MSHRTQQRPVRYERSIPRRWRIRLTAAAAAFAIVIIGGSITWNALQGPLHTVTAEKNAVIAKAEAVKNAATGLKTAPPAPAVAPAAQSKFLTTVKSAIGGSTTTDAALLKAGTAVCTLSNSTDQATIEKVITVTDGSLTATAAGAIYQAAKTNLCP